jgi:hypothetical protein
MLPEVNELMKDCQYIIDTNAKDITLSCHHLGEEYQCFPPMVSNHIIVICNIFFYFFFLFQLLSSQFALVIAYFKQNGKVGRLDMFTNSKYHEIKQLIMYNPDLPYTFPTSQPLTCYICKRVFSIEIIFTLF